MPLLLPPAFQAPAQESPEALRERLSALDQAKKWDELSDAFEALTPQQRGRWLTDWVDALFKAGRYARAAEIADAGLSQLPPTDGRVLPLRLQRARSLSRLGRHGDAGIAWEQLGDGLSLENALAEFREALDWPSCERVARALLAGAKNETAAWRAKSQLGEALAREDRFREAEPLLQGAADTGSTEAFVWSNLARCLNARKAWAEALAACDQALRIDPKVLEARFNHGRAAFELHRYAESVSDFEAALALLPEDPVLKENLKQAKRYAEAQSKSNKNKK